MTEYLEMFSFTVKELLIYLKGIDLENFDSPTKKYNFRESVEIFQIKYLFRSKR